MEWILPTVFLTLAALLLLAVLYGCAVVFLSEWGRILKQSEDKRLKEWRGLPPDSKRD
jgi:hypothetical protein